MLERFHSKKIYFMIPLLTGIQKRSIADKYICNVSNGSLVANSHHRNITMSVLTLVDRKIVIPFTSDLYWNFCNV